MKKIWPLVVLGIVSYVVFAIATLPARLLVARLAPVIVADGVQGTVWNGEAQVVQQGSVFLGSIDWKLHPLALFTGKVKADVRINRPDGFGQATVVAGFSNRVTLSDVTASLPLSAFATPGRWMGTLNARMKQLSLVDGWPERAEGQLEVVDLIGPANRPAALGGYRVIFPPGMTGNELVGAVGDMGGPLDLAGNVRLKNDRSYELEGSVAARPDAPKSIADSLQYLGAPDAQGRRPFSIAGTL